MHNWKVRQFKSDVSTERVRRFRKLNETKNETFHETTRNEKEDVTGDEGNGSLERFRSVSVSDSVSENSKKLLYGKFDELVAKWPDPTDVDNAFRFWISLVDAGEITTENVHEVFEGLERWKKSRQWADGKKHSVSTWLGFSKDGRSSVERSSATEAG